MIEPKKIVRSRRKTIALVIDSDGELIVRAPFYASENDILRFVREKQNWIEQKAKEMKQKTKERPRLSLQEGETIPYLGRECMIFRGMTRKICFDGNAFLLPESEDAGAKLVSWYKKRAAVILKERVESIAEKMQVSPGGVRITSAKTRWGSCSYTNHLNFTWRLIMCPPEVVDYVVVHELCHIIHKNHSKSFWNCVEGIDTSYREHEKWLKENRRLMEVI
ncbi:MAG: M48 family metallopeptidase [Lachnospiraceae bacterium]|nr:M48 family metallopeptidase [Lachnospiraceae bacterium]